MFNIHRYKHSSEVTQAVPAQVPTRPEDARARLREKFTSIAHRHHTFCSPMSEETAEEILTRLLLKAGDRALDVGCGKAELLIRMAERFGVAGVGVDRSAAFLAEARRRCGQIKGQGRVEFLELDAAHYTPAGELFDIGICIGGGGGFGFFTEVVDRMGSLVRKNGGLLVIGECYWKQPPSPEYLEFLGVQEGTYLSHEANLELAVKRGLTVRWHGVSSLKEWDDYEALYARSVREYADANPNDPDVPAMLSRIAKWERMYQAQGRATLGFGFYILQQGAAGPT